MIVYSNRVQYSTVHDRVQYSTVHDRVQYNTVHDRVQYSTVHHRVRCEQKVCERADRICTVAIIMIFIVV